MLNPTRARVGTFRTFRRLAPLLLLLGLLAPAAPLPAQAPPPAAPSLEALRENALRCERQGQWQEACRWYDEILRKDRNRADARRGYQRCLRRHLLARRHADPSYRDAIDRLKAEQALDVYEQVLHAVGATYVDRRKATVTALFRHGLQELRLALEEKAFLDAYLPGVRPGGPALRAFQARLESWPAVKLADAADAREQVLAVVAAAREVGLRPGRDLVKVIGLEFAAGACNALDEHTLFLTPGHFSDTQAALAGRLVAVGVELAAVPGGLEVSRVYPNGPAQEAGLQEHDRLVEVDGKPVESLPADEVAGRLRGKPGTPVKLKLLPADGMMPRTVTLVRRPVVVPSVEQRLYTVTTAADEPVSLGWLRISSFQETTPQEVKEAIAVLRTGGMGVPGIKGLVLDLRGNPGGLFKSAVEVAELFLNEGVIVITHSQFPDFNQSHRARGGHALLLPLVVLIDGETASAAEVVAGALKGKRPSILLAGQTTFGKGTIQCLVPLDKVPLERMPAGIRITVARFCSPADQPVNGRGVEPNVVLDADGPAAVQQALGFLLTLLDKPMAPGMPMPNPMPMPVAAAPPMQ